MAHSSSRRVREHAHRTQLLTEQLTECRAALAARVPNGIATPAFAARRPDAFAEVRRVYSCGHGTTLPGTDRRDEGDARVHDRSVNEAYDSAGKTWSFYKDVFRRDSIDGHGLHLISSVHYDAHYDNAFWNGAEMVYGDGDGELFGSFTHCIDVIGHELAHGVTQAACDLEYDDQSGALNESVSDVFGSLVKQYTNKQQAHQADWLIGNGLFLKASGVRALRSMSAPGTAFDDPRLGGKDPQPAHMRDYVEDPGDNGGVHINSGIPNHAFYRAAMLFGGNAWEKAGHIWYETLHSGLDRRSSFAAFAHATLETADRRFGKLARAVVTDAWKSVGVKPRA